MAGRSDLLAQNSTPQTPAQSDNPFPGEQPKTPDAPKPNAGQGSANKGTQSAPDPSNGPPKTAPKTEQKPASDNPFPGEDTNAPIIPVDPGPGAAAGTDSGRAGSEAAAPANATAGRDADPDGDPVRTPDAPGQTADDGFSSSRSGVANLPAEDDNDGRPGKSTKNKTREQVIQEDLDVGGFYIEKKNWKAAQARYAAAFALDGENADSVWGLAEAERHLGLYKEAAGHYTLFLSYDPDGPHSRAAKKALGEVEIAASGAKHPDAQNAQPK